MKSKLIIFVILFSALTPVFGQKAMVTLNFTGILDGQYVVIDSIHMQNYTHPGDTTLHWPDTALVFNITGLSADLNPLPGFTLFQVKDPNFQQDGIVKITIPETGYVEILLIDVLGRIQDRLYQKLQAGTHDFSVYSGNLNTSVLSVRYNGNIKNIRMLPIISKNLSSDKLIYSGMDETIRSFKSLPTNAFMIFPGDTLKVTGYSGNQSTDLTISPQTSTNYTLNFGMSLACPGLPFFVYGGQTYNTIQIGSQCWMRENLNIGVRVNSNYTGAVHSDVSNNGVIEKYCYNNDSTFCATYGGLYEWDEMMQYDSTEGGQGICPNGWHVPTELDWCTLSMFLDSTVECIFWQGGINCGGKLKENGLTHWATPNLGATNESMFTGLGAGMREYRGNFKDLTLCAYFWTSTQYALLEVLIRGLIYVDATIYKANYQKMFGFSVRCIKSN